MEKYKCDVCGFDIFSTGRNYLKNPYGGFNVGNLHYKCMKCGKIYTIAEFVKLGESNGDK